MVARVLCGCEAGCGVLADHGAGSSEQEVKQTALPRANCRVHRRTPMIEGGSPPEWSWPGKEDTGDVGSEVSRGGYGERI